MSQSLDLHGAEIQGAVGYAIQQVLGNVYRARGVDLPLAAVVTRIEVDPDDPAFARPTRPVGPPHSAAQARRLGRERGSTFAGSAARGHRRVVAVPTPRRVVDVDALRRLLAAGGVVAAGVGRVPVIATPGGYRGVEAILETDATVALLGTALPRTDWSLTGVDRVEVGHRTSRAIGVERLSVADARALLMANEFPSGSMGSKVEAAIDFVQGGGREAIITSLPGLRAALDGRAGPHRPCPAPRSIEPECPEREAYARGQRREAGRDGLRSGCAHCPARSRDHSADARDLGWRSSRTPPRASQLS